VERATAALLSIDVLIDALMAGTRLPFQRETTRNLFRTPLLAQQCLDALPRRGTDAWAVGGAVAGES
jgi:hypothetical protein